MARVEVSNGITIEYDVRGEGDPILFIMGLSGQLIDWPEEFVDLFAARGYQVIRFDNRDSGLSSQADWEPPSIRRSMMSMLSRRPLRDVGYTVEDMAVDAAQLLGALDIDSAHVVGISMGGMIAQAMAVNHPNKVRSLCSIASKPGDRRSGGIALSLIRQLRRRPEPTRENAVAESLRIIRAVSGDHFDAERHRLNATASVQRSFTSSGTAPPGRSHRREPGPHQETRQDERADACDPRNQGSTRQTQRWDRDRCGNSQFAPADAARYGP